jgi:hypothetical protein
MRFMMFVLADPVPDEPTDDSDVDHWVQELDTTGRRLLGDMLDPSEARGVRVRAGERLVTKGPIPGATDTLRGCDILDCADLDEALDIAARHPMARNGRLELPPSRTRRKPTAERTPERRIPRHVVGLAPLGARRNRRAFGPSISRGVVSGRLPTPRAGRRAPRPPRRTGGRA